MSLHFHEISEANHRILNPFTEEKLMLLGEICRLTPQMRHLDLCCGKAEMLCRWSQRWGIHGVGVDISAVFIKAAHDRAVELGVSEQINLIQADASTYSAEPNAFDIVSCIGATWIGNGLVGTLKLLQPALKSGGLILVGEPYWTAPPPDSLCADMDMNADDYATLVGTLDRIESSGFEVVEMVLADGDSWDRYVAGQWFTVDSWLRSNPDAPEAAEVRAVNSKWKRIYLSGQRQYFGWGVFVLREKETV